MSRCNYTCQFVAILSRVRQLNTVPQRVLTSVLPPPANNMSAEPPPHKCQNVGPDRPLPKAKKARSNTKRVEGTAIEKRWSPRETDIPPDEKWMRMGTEWFSNLQNTTTGKRMKSSIRSRCMQETKSRLLAYVMLGTLTTEKAGQTMWVLKHCGDKHYVLFRTSSTTQ